MKSPTRSKEVIEQRLREIAEELISLNECPVLHKKMTLEEKLSCYSVEWRNLYTEGCEEICLYAMKLYPENVFEGKVSRAARHGVLLMKIAHDCFKNFKPKNGDFINYISHVISTEFSRAEQKEFVEEKRSGIKSSEKLIRLAKDFISFAEGMGKNPQDQKVQEWYCTHNGIELEDLHRSLRAEIETNVMGESFQNDEGEEVSIFDKIAFLDSEIESGNDCVERYELFFKRIEKCFENQQDRTKKYVSALLTFNLLKDIELNVKAGLHLEVLNQLEKYSFAEKMLIGRWKQGEDIGTQKDIALSFKPDLSENNAESDASRTMRKFWNKFEK